MTNFRLRAAFVAALLFFHVLPFYALEAPPELHARSAVLYDFATGRILYGKEPDMAIPPASMTKLVTLYLGWQYLEEGGSPDEKVEITPVGSAFSRPEGSSLMLLEEGQNVTFMEIMKGLAVASGNDAAYALAEHISGNPGIFVGKMNNLMSSLGYTRMHFVDPDGWSAGNSVTAGEYASFAADYIRRFPRSLEMIHSLRTFTYPEPENMTGGMARISTPRIKENTNILLGKVEGVDGLKTGYIDESGFNFTATAKRGITRFIAVIMGIVDVPYLEGIQLRADEADALLEYGFRNYKTIEPELPVFDAVKLWEGREDSVEVEAVGEPVFTLSADDMPRFSREINLPEELTAPLVAGQQVGSVVYKTGGETLGEFPVVVSDGAERGNIFKVLWHRTIRLFNP